jgi:hypothetical protein
MEIQRRAGAKQRLQLVSDESVRSCVEEEMSD